MYFKPKHYKIPTHNVNITIKKDNIKKSLK